MTPQEYEELRQDYLDESRQDGIFEMKMRRDIDFFIKNSNYEELVEELKRFRNTCESYGWNQREFQL